MTDHSYSSREPTVQRERASLDELLEALSKPPRRRILTALAEANPRDEAEFAPGEFTSAARRQELLTRLHHTHLPKLDEAGFIEWDPDSKTITRGPRFDEIAPLVELMIAHRDELPVGWP
ncbi:transcriptional regulator [Natronococcus pandeyae]|uniref:Transcriptional regulator n=1 Tax=Natronococcus pandeyae TaxID=2055836 RepID=A0A8J8TQQ1_9EURY|nr:ArsR family transcriptional regulator [Natronococcus pandeyae]TYL39126.1 transcriptional regulator [Natronococcus pandeyae]